MPKRGSIASVDIPLEFFSDSKRSLVRTKNVVFNFNMKRDVILLKTSIAINPWKFGEGKWADVSSVLQKLHRWPMDALEAKDRVDDILSEVKSEESQSIYSSSPEKKERAELAEKVAGLQKKYRKIVFAQNSKTVAADLALTDSCDSAEEAEPRPCPQAKMPRVKAPRPEACRKEAEALVKLKEDLSAIPVQDKRQLKSLTEQIIRFEKRERTTATLERIRRREAKFERKINTMLRHSRLKAEGHRPQDATERKCLQNLTVAQFQLEKTVADFVKLVAEVLGDDSQ